MGAMTANQALGRIIQQLDHAGIPYMLTGSLASSLYGVPRSTLDIDIVIAPTLIQLKTLVQVLPQSDYYADLSMAMESLKHESMFNVIDQQTGWKIDFIMCKSRPYSQIAFERRQSGMIDAVSLLAATPEDVIISKLEWAKMGESSRQIRDVAGILKLRSDSLDRAYLERWIKDLDLQSQWDAACRESII